MIFYITQSRFLTPKFIEWTTIDKSSWGPGPWQSESDKIQWQDPTTSLPCLIHRGASGALCGYVGLSEGHPAYYKHHDDIPVECHGGLTFSSLCQQSPDPSHGICHVPSPGEPDHVWWVGFDCCHAYDLIPAFNAIPALADLYNNQDRTYRDLAYVKDQVCLLAQQLSNLKEV